MPIETIENHHIQLKPSCKHINYIIENIKNVRDVPKNISVLKNIHKNKHINCLLSLKDIKWLKLYLSKLTGKCNKKVYIHKLLEGIILQLPVPKITDRNVELAARIKKLQDQQNIRDYKNMTKDIDSFRKHLPQDTIAFQLKFINKQLIAVIQFIFSVIAGFVFGFNGMQLIIGNLDFGFRLLLGIISALIIALAEIYFLAKKLNEDYHIPLECK